MSKSGKTSDPNQSILESMADLTAIQDQGEVLDDQHDEVENQEDEESIPEGAVESHECLITLLAPHRDLRRDFDYLSKEIQDNITNCEKARADWKGKFLLSADFKIILEEHPEMTYTELRNVSEYSTDSSSLPSYQQLFDDDDSDTGAIAPSDIQSSDAVDYSEMDIFEGGGFSFYKFLYFKELWKFNEQAGDKLRPLILSAKCNERSCYLRDLFIARVHAEIAADPNLLKNLPKDFTVFL